MLEEHSSGTIHAESSSDETFKKTYLTKSTLNEGSVVNNSNEESSLHDNIPVSPGSKFNQQVPTTLQSAVSDVDTASSRNGPLHCSKKERKLSREWWKEVFVIIAEISDNKQTFDLFTKRENQLQ